MTPLCKLDFFFFKRLLNLTAKRQISYSLYLVLVPPSVIVPRVSQIGETKLGGAEDSVEDEGLRERRERQEIHYLADENLLDDRRRGALREYLGNGFLVNI